MLFLCHLVLPHLFLISTYLMIVLPHLCLISTYLLRILNYILSTMFVFTVYELSNDTCHLYCHRLTSTFFQTLRFHCLHFRHHELPQRFLPPGPAYKPS
jgi:hypothetical protein